MSYEPEWDGKIEGYSKNQISKNLIHSDHPLTGPLARGDQNTIKKHIQGGEIEFVLDITKKKIK